MFPLDEVPFLIPHSHFLLLSFKSHFKRFFKRFFLNLFKSHFKRFKRFKLQIKILKQENTVERILDLKTKNHVSEITPHKVTLEIWTYPPHQCEIRKRGQCYECLFGVAKLWLLRNFLLLYFFPQFSFCNMSHFLQTSFQYYKFIYKQFIQCQH